jgi:hypothetical protein
MSYLLSKLSEINRRIAVHEGNANRRLGSEARKILLLFPTEMPEKYKNQFEELHNLIKQTLADLPASGLTPTKLSNIRNSTAANYIKLLKDIEDNLEHDDSSSF